MSSKRTLVKQKVTYGSAGDGNLHESDEDFSGKRSPTKRVSFNSHELSDSDSDAENSLGRINRSSAGPAGDSLDGLFRESSPKDRQRSVESIKRTSVERQGSKDKYSPRENKEQPRPAPRPRPTIAVRRPNFEGPSVTASQQSSDEESDDLSAITWPMKTKEKKEAKDRQPIPPPRTSPRQHQEKSSSSDMVSPRPVPRSRPPLSLREGNMKLFQQDSDVQEYERIKHLERDSESREYEKTKTAPDKPMPSLRRKKTLDKTQENLTRAQIPVVRTSTFEDDGPFVDKNDTKKIEQAGNLRHGQLKKVEGRPLISVAKSDSSEESGDDSRRINRPGLVSSKKYYEEEQSHDRTFRDPKEESGPPRVPPKPGRPLVSVARSDSSEESGDDSRRINRPGLVGSKKYYEEEQSRDRTFRDPKEESEPPRVPPKPSPRSRMMVDNSMKKHEPSEEEGNHVKRPGSAPLMKKSSSLETPSKQGSLTNKKALSGSKEQGIQKMQLKKSLTPQRPMSAKKSSLMTKLKVQSGITDTFEEHVPSTAENIIGTQDGRGFRKKGASDFDSGGGRSGPLKANQAISKMTQSLHPRETPTYSWTGTKSVTHDGTLTPKRSSSMTNLRGASPDSWSEMGSARGSQHVGLMDTATIRQAVFDEWRTKKRERLKEQLASKSAENKKLEEKEKEERERKKMAKRAFESWNEQKQEENKEKNAKRKGLMDKELEKQKEKNLKARDAKKYFESWKVKKDEELKEEHQKKKEEQRNKKKKEEEKKQEKTLSAQKVYEDWKKNKDEKLKEEVKNKRKEGIDNTMKEEEEKYERSIQCAERYQAWVEKKGKPQRGLTPPTLTQRSWCPSGRKSNNYIPEKVGAVIQAPSPNRSRTMSGSYYFKTNKF